MILPERAAAMTPWPQQRGVRGDQLQRGYFDRMVGAGVECLCEDGQVRFVESTCLLGPHIARGLRAARPLASAAPSTSNAVGWYFSHTRRAAGKPLHIRSHSVTIMRSTPYDLAMAINRSSGLGLRLCSRMATIVQQSGRVLSTAKHFLSPRPAPRRRAFLLTQNQMLVRQQSKVAEH